MSHLPTRLTAAALAAALGGTLLLQSPATAAAPAAVPTVAPAAAPATATAAFRYEVYFPKYVRRGGYLTYTVKVHNRKTRGQHYVALVGTFSSHFRTIKVVRKPRSVKCSVDRPAVACRIASLDKGDSTTVTIRAWVGPRRGTATAKFGAVVTDDPDARLSELRKRIRGGIKARSRVL
ncbi:MULTISPECIES: hypothetical protein [Streptosporangium]|uniref:DUF11 domain-containing protein n=1 Tax=Streptosporangium brasiliense TaxID=47480 RepID=A0ABT9QYU2_9ACTN|nr:hypothetical protein [Streptosporangium brasiliense]MDP9862156.1 hypothetical protein [Streptosporangium brasiliense]